MSSVIFFNYVFNFLTMQWQSCTDFPNTNGVDYPDGEFPNTNSLRKEPSAPCSSPSDRPNIFNCCVSSDLASRSIGDEYDQL